MKVTFIYAPSLIGPQTTPESLALGNRHSPLAPMDFEHTGEAQASFPPRALAKTFFGRGGGHVVESFIAQKEHTSYFAAVIWTRVTLGNLRGRQGTLQFDANDGTGRVRLLNCVCIKARGHLVGLVSFVNFQFIGGSWVNG